jgi:L-threonylcarbamoyladenylate synthase
VQKIYIAKGRPSSSPLIVHVDSIEMARWLAREWPEKAEKLARRFWPGPLTLVLLKKPRVPDELTAGLDTVGIRMPSNPIALALIREAGLPVAAPSANRFSELSPTTAEHVRTAMGDRVAMVLDGGRTTIGIESTVLSLAGPEAILLRPGMISQAEIEEVIGTVRVQPEVSGLAHPSPGMHRRHYSPKTPLILVKPGQPSSGGHGVRLQMPTDPSQYAAVLYERLHEADSENWDWIEIELPPGDPAWAAIRDRLERAAAR